LRQTPQREDLFAVFFAAVFFDFLDFLALAMTESSFVNVR